MGERSLHADQTCYKSPFIARQLSVFSAPANKVDQDHMFPVPRWSCEQLACSGLSWFRLLLGGNRPMSSWVILMKTVLQWGEQSARGVHVMKGVWISLLPPKG
jgi:hypothetical protein